MSRSSAVRRGHHYSWAVILADLCTGEPVDGRSVVVLSGTSSKVPHSLLLRHIPPPSRFLESYLQEGTFFAPCQVVQLYYFTSFRRYPRRNDVSLGGLRLRRPIEPVDGRSVVILSGMLSAVPHSLLLRHNFLFCQNLAALKNKAALPCTVLLSLGGPI